MQYTLLFYENQTDFENRQDPKASGEYWAAWTAYMEALREAGIVAGGNALQPSNTATTIKLSSTGKHIQDGPYADTKEQLGGYILIEVPDLDTALDWAAKSPSASSGAVEVRPVLPMN